MKKVISFISMLLIASSAYAQSACIWTDNPVGPGCSIIPQRSGLDLGTTSRPWDTINAATINVTTLDATTFNADTFTGTLPNNTYLKAKNAAGTADIDIIKVDATDDTIINSDASDVIKLQIGGDANRLFTFNASSDAAHTVTFGDSGTTASQTLDITASTSDGDDDSQIQICAGGACSGTRGAYILLEGEEEAGAGRMQIVTGASGTFSLTQGGGTALVINGSQAATFYGTVTSNRATDLGWSWQAAANQACNTTCTNACVGGIDTGVAFGASAFVACATATADVCLCAGAS